MTLWGKTMAELDEDHRRMLAERQAREQNATPQQLGRHFGNALQPVRRDYHFGTDIPIPTWQEVEAERARRGEDDMGGPLFGIMAVSAIVLALVLAILYIAVT